MLKIKCLKQARWFWYISDWIIHSVWLCACRSHRCRHRSGLRSQTYSCRRRRRAERRRTCTVWNKRSSVWRRVCLLGKPSWTASSTCWRHRRTRWTRSHTPTRIPHTFITLFFTRCPSGHSRFTHGYLLKGKEPSLCLLCQTPVLLNIF